MATEQVEANGMVAAKFHLQAAASLAALQYVSPTIANQLGEVEIPTFQLANQASLGAWTAAVLFLISASLCLLIFSIRRQPFFGS